MDKTEAEDFFAILFRGKHHIPSEVKPYGAGWVVSYFNDMATFDFNELTRLVFLAHDKCMRASVFHGGPRRIRIAIWKRSMREGMIHERHPTIETALKDWRIDHEIKA